MGIKKYELITDGSNKRIKALRSFQVQDRYVNIGDVGGIVYDEKTLSQDGNAWIFKGNMGSPTIRISGDAIVDITEGAVSGAVKALLTIDGQSKVVGAAANLNVRTSGAAWELTPAMFEQGNFDVSVGKNWKDGGIVSPNYLRLKQPIYVGAAAGMSLAFSVAGYVYQAYWLDRDGNGVNSSAGVASGVGVTLPVPPTAVYLYLKLRKEPGGTIVPADVATAKPTLSNGTVEGSFLIRDSAITINNTSAGTAAFAITQTGLGVNGASVPGSSIVNSTVNIFKPGNLSPSLLIATDLVNTNATITTTAANTYDLLGVYDNVKNLMVTSELGIQRGAAGAETIITAKDCQDFAYSSLVFPGAAAAQTANRPFRFVRCNVPNGRFYHHTQIANTYKNIDFALAQTDLGKATANAGITLVSSEVEGMYRLYANGFGALVESHDSVKSLNIASANLPASYGTTIYKDAYLNGLFDIAGTNVFGNKVRSHPLAQVLNVQPRAVQGLFNTVTVGGTITGVTANANRVCVPTPFRVNGSKGLTINCPTGIEGAIVCTDISGVIKGLTALATGESSVPAAQLVNTNAYVFFGKAGGAAITPEDLAGVTVTVYNGCKIVNTGETAVSMKGNIRVEDNATLINSSIAGTGYFGGNAIASSLFIAGSVFMKDNAKFIKTAGTSVIRNLRVTDNGYILVGNITGLGVVHVKDNAVLSPTAISATECDIMLSDNAVVTSGVSINGVLVMEENASIEAATTVIGAITLSGNYKGSAVKTWTGKRTITDVNAPEYDNNVKTQYDF